MIVTRCLTFCGCASASQVVEPKVENQESNVDVQANTTGEEEMVSRLSELLGCKERTAESIYQTIDQNIKGTMTEITYEDQNGVSCLYVKTDAKKQYFVVVSDTFVVDEIYENNDKGKRIYISMM